MIRKNSDAPKRKSEIRGCCDLGSSYFRLLVVTGVFPEPALLARGRLGIRSCLDERRYAGWGADIAAGGVVGPETLSRALAALGELLAISREAGCAHPVLVGTATLRDASNAGAIRDALEREALAPVRVLSQREEAALGFRGAAFFSERRERLCLVDIGGTSTEVSWGSGIEMEGCAGFPIGTHRVQAVLVARDGGAPSAGRIAELLSAGPQQRIVAGLGDYRLPQGIGDSTMLVTGGTATTLALVGRLMRGSSPVFEGVERMTIDDLAAVRMHLAEVFGTGAESSLPFDEGRIRLLPAGVLLMESLLRALGARAFAVTARDLRWGVILTGRRLER